MPLSEIYQGVSQGEGLGVEVIRETRPCLEAEGKAQVRRHGIERCVRRRGM